MAESRRQTGAVQKKSAESRRIASYAALSGLATGLLSLTPAASLGTLGLAALFGLAAKSTSPARVLFAFALPYVGAHLWWVMALTAKIFGAWPAGALAWVLYVIEAGFFAALGLVVGRLVQGRARVWALAGGWVLLESLRGLGPLAFPWPNVGMLWLDTPIMQTADLWGLLGVTWLTAFTAAALAHAYLERRPHVLLAPAALLGLSLGYGLTRVAGEGELSSAVIVRENQERISSLRAASVAARTRPQEPVIWPETTLLDSPQYLTQFPSPGLSGVGAAAGQAPLNTVAVLEGGRVTDSNSKGRPVPFGESFPTFGGLAAPIYRAVEAATGFYLSESVQPARDMRVLHLGGVRWGAYVCYDSVFSWPARKLAAQGAEVLVNVSNDSWFLATGAGQHYNMGRVRAIETRRWLLRSVQRGRAGSVNDLGQSVETLNETETARSVGYRRLNSVTPYVRVGDWPALALALALVGWGLRYRHGDNYEPSI